MAGVMAQCGGLQCMLNRLAGVKDFKQGRHLLTVSCGQYDCQALYVKLWLLSHLTLEGSVVQQRPVLVLAFPKPWTSELPSAPSSWPHCLRSGRWQSSPVPL